MILADSAWAFGWTAIAGIAGAVAGVATMALAFVTWLLARSTKDMVAEADQDIRSQWRPIVAIDQDRNIEVTIVKIELKVVPPVGDDGRTSVRIEFGLVNRGRGPALNLRMAARPEVSTHGCDFTENRLSLLALETSREVALYGFIEKPDDVGPTADFSEILDLDYEDVAGNQYRTTLELRGQAPGYDKSTQTQKTTLGVARIELTSGSMAAVSGGRA